LNPFVDLKKRSIQLPKGAKDLVDLLQGGRQKAVRQGTCEYCSALSVVRSFMRQKDRCWCAECWRDLTEFAARQEFKFNFDVADEAAISSFRNEVVRRQDAFMQQRLTERKPM
jgi:hypothetical protein